MYRSSIRPYKKLKEHRIGMCLSVYCMAECSTLVLQKGLGSNITTNWCCFSTCVYPGLCTLYTHKVIVQSCNSNLLLCPKKTLPTIPQQLPQPTDSQNGLHQSKTACTLQRYESSRNNNNSGSQLQNVEKTAKKQETNQ